MSPLPAPFIVYALPRSRTAWLARFLSYGPWHVTHDAMMEFDEARDLKGKLASPYVGVVETGMAFGWKLARRYAPEARLAVVRRSANDVTASLARFGVSMDAAWLQENEAGLDELAALPGTVSVSFNELDTEEGCRKIFEHCTMQPFDRAWWLQWRDENVQIDMPDFLRRFEARADIANGVIDEMRSLVTPCTFQAERWGGFYPECLPLMKMHSDEVGLYHPKMPYDPNVEEGERMDAAGRGIVVTARAAGRLVGYLCFYFFFNLESKRVLCAGQSGTFMHPDFRPGGNWLSLYAEAIRLMKARGVQMLYPRHGKRGGGPDMALFFKKLGAEENGRDYTLWIGD